MTKLRNILFALFSLAPTLLLSGCKAAVLDPKGIVAAAEEHLLIDAVLLMLIIVVPVIILTLVIAWKYRASNANKAKYTPEWSHSTLLEIVWWTIPCVIILILATITWVSTHALDPYKPLAVKTKPLNIQVISLNWKWLFIYPDQKIATVNYVQMPVNVPVRFYITSDAPMNSFQIQQLAGQIYAMAGMQTKINIIADTVGDYRGLSTNYSGEGFSGMNFVTHVSTQQDFDKWVKRVKQSSDRLTMDAYNKLVEPSQNVAPEYFSGVVDGLFNTVIMKYMMPMKDMQNMQDQGAEGMAGMPNMSNKSDKQEKKYTTERNYSPDWNKGKKAPSDTMQNN